MSTATDTDPVNEPLTFRGEDPEFVPALIRLQREAAAELDRLIGALAQVAELPSAGLMYRPNRHVDKVLRDTLLREFKYLDGPVRQLIHAASGLLEEGVLTEAQRLQLRFGAGALEGKYLTVVDLIAALKPGK